MLSVAVMSPFSINLRHLRALPALAASGSVTAAADAIGMSQPSLTQGLSALERRLGTRLFDRRPGGVSATPQGAILIDRASLALGHLAEASRAALGPTRRGFAHADRLITATQLRAFLALAETGSLAGAATATGLSQPALHRAVRDLERVCGTSLAERNGRSLQLTRAGRLVARGARLARAELAAALAEIGGNPAGPIVIGAMPLARARALPTAIAAFVARQPRVPVKVVEGSWRELVEPLRDGVLDLMVGAMRDDPPAYLTQRLLFEDEPVVVARRGHPLLGRRVGPADLRRFDWIVAAPGAPLRSRWETMFADGDRPMPAVECGSVMVIRGVLADSDLLALVSPDQVEIELAAGLLSIVDAELPGGARRIALVHRSGWRPTPAQAHFVELLEMPAMSSGKAMAGPLF